MNRGVPRSVAEHKAIGKRTDILTCGKLKLLIDALHSTSPKQIWHMKVTRMGNAEWQQLREIASGPLFRYPWDQNDRVHERVGSSPSTGIRVLDLLSLWSRPTKVSVYGCNWFGAMGGSPKSWWNMAKDPDRSHHGNLELAAFIAMGYGEVKALHWEK